MRWPRRQQQHLERQLGAAEGREVKICLFLSGKKKIPKKVFPFSARLCATDLPSYKVKTDSSSHLWVSSTSLRSGPRTSFGFPPSTPPATIHLQVHFSPFSLGHL